MTKSEIIISLVKEHFSFTFKGINDSDRAIIFTKDEFRSQDILLNNIEESSIAAVKDEYICFLKQKEK